MSEFKYVKLEESIINQDVLNSFDCGHPDFNNFLQEDAITESSEGNGVTYILVDKKEYEIQKISIIFAFTTICATSLPYYEGNSDILHSISCVEIKYFAIGKRFHHQTAFLIDADKYYSTIFFEYLLQDLYQMSTSILGFQMIFLRANENGMKLYKRKKFTDATRYLIPFDPDDKYGKCTPMCLQMNDDLYNIFGIV